MADALRDHFTAATASAEYGYRYGSGDEDTLTGALGQALLKPTTRLLTSDGVVTFSVEYYKTRGRGRGAPERPTGADGIFQIEVHRADGELIRAKGLPFQAKKNWRTKDMNLQGQCNKMIRKLGTGIVVDYSAKGYAACEAEAVMEAQGDRRAIARARQMSPLRKLLGEDFVNCDAGRVGLYYDPEREVFVVPEEEGALNEDALHVVHAKVLKPF